MATVLLWAAVTAFLLMTSVFVLALLRDDNSIVDIFWGIGFIAVAVVTYGQFGSGHPRQILLLALVGFWGSRLAIHLFVRNRGQGEDPRYRKWREEWGRWFVLRSFLQIYMLQGALLLVIVSPLFWVMAEPGGPLTLLDGAGVAVWALGFLFETVGDWQLLRFIRDPGSRDRILQSGLWRYSRHPNYFGEATLWWGIFLIGLGAPGGWAGIVSPLTIDFLLLYVSGIPILEKKYEGNPVFEDYKRRTNALLPWFPKNADSD